MAYGSGMIVQRVGGTWYFVIDGRMWGERQGKIEDRVVEVCVEVEQRRVGIGSGAQQ